MTKGEEPRQAACVEDGLYGEGSVRQSEKEAADVIERHDGCGSPLAYFGVPRERLDIKFGGDRRPIVTRSDCR